MFCITFSDKHGRKPVFLVAASILTGLYFFALYSPTIIHLFASLFTMGLFSLTRSSSGYMLKMEFASKEHQPHYMMVGAGFEGFSKVLIAVTIYFTIDYRYHTYIAGVGFLVFIVLILLLVPETPHFLYSKRKFKELKQCLMLMSKVNKRHNHCEQKVD